MAENIVEQLINSNDLWKHKRFVRYKDGAVLYSMSLNQFKKLAQDADAIYKYGKMVLVNTKIVDIWNTFMCKWMNERIMEKVLDFLEDKKYTIVRM